MTARDFLALAAIAAFAAYAHGDMSGYALIGAFVIIAPLYIVALAGAKFTARAALAAWLFRSFRR